MYKSKEKAKEYKKEWYIKNKERLRIKQKEYQKIYNVKNKKIRAEKAIEYRDKLKYKVLAHYGQKCNCCGEIMLKFLTIDHVNNDGNKDRQGKNKYRISGWFLYKKIIKENFPDTYQILCMNCNFGKRMNNGICPHKNK